MPSMPHWRRSASRCAADSGDGARMPWREERRSPTTRRSRAALEFLAASVGKVTFVQFSALLRAPELQDSRLRRRQCGTAGRRTSSPRIRRCRSCRLAGVGRSCGGRCANGTGGGRAATARGPSDELSELQRRAAASASGSPSGWTPSRPVPGLFRSRWSSIEYQAAERFRELLASLSVGDAIFGTHSRDSAQGILARAARETAFQVQTGVPAIWVSGQLLDPWLDYARALGQWLQR